jgi:transposase, IS5 family
MQTPAEKTTKMLLVNTEEELFENFISADHPFRKLSKIINWSELVDPLRECYSELGAIGIDVEKGVKALLVQFWENYSDRQMEGAIRENIAIRWFCGFSLTEETPDYSYFSKLRKRIGTKAIADLFNRVNARLEQYGLFGNVFTFIDASAIVTKTALWEERDKAIKEGAEKLNNVNVKDYAADRDARWGAKSKNKIWFGYKRHEAVDMRHGLVKKVATTPANVLDNHVVGSICPKQGAVFADKLYDTKKASNTIRGKGCHSATIRKNNNAEKDRDLDRWRSGIRMPFEGTFSKRQKHARYRGRIKVTMQCFLEATVHNLKKAVCFTPQVTLLAPL